jgi:23S rRNA U2552 (ribose-2'-O)-methylase RlmE/FtsJ
MSNVKGANLDDPTVGSSTSSPSIDTFWIVKNYLLAAAPSYKALSALRKKVENCSHFVSSCLLLRQGWENPAGDQYFKELRFASDNASPDEQKRFFSMMQSLGREMNDATGAFSCRHPKMLDLCMAPGGYAASLLNLHPYAIVKGISLPPSLGGHTLLVRHGATDPRVEVQFMDITMLATEFGVTIHDVPPHHPEASHFNHTRPYHGQQFDVVICDGQVLRTHTRASWRQYYEATRLKVSQLILGLQRIKTGGTFIILLHKAESWNTCTLLKAFDAFSSVILFKPVRKHAQRSSFYLVAKNVQPESSSAKETLEEWKQLWYGTTFGVDTRTEYAVEHPKEEVVTTFLQEFGPRLVELGSPIWETQANALKRASYVQHSY